MRRDAHAYDACCVVVARRADPFYVPGIYNGNFSPLRPWKKALGIVYTGRAIYVPDLGLGSRGQSRASGHRGASIQFFISWNFDRETGRTDVGSGRDLLGDFHRIIIKPLIAGAGPRDQAIATGK